jgi:hypothetical protein
LAVHGEDGLPLAEPGDLRLLYLQHITGKALVVDQQNQFRERKASFKYVVKQRDSKSIDLQRNRSGGINCNSKG